jgi:tetratricopeptide (TPR) repeat protein
MPQYFCTYFDRNYLIKGITLINSLNHHSTQEIQIYAICLDEITRLILNKLALPNTYIIALHDIELRDTPLLEAKRNRSLVEYYWTLTPTIILRILEKYSFIDVLTYLDADLFFYASPDPIWEEFGSSSVLIHEHRFSPEQAFLQKYGKYNVGLLCFRNDANGLEVLKWWRARCLEWCYAKLENGKYGDQLYLNNWPKKFSGVVVLQNIGAGVAPWNHIQYEFSKNENGNIFVNGSPLVFYHFHSLTFVEPDILIPTIYLTNSLTTDLLNYCFVQYANELHKTLKRVKEIVPGYRFGLFNQQILNEKHTFIAKQSQFERLKHSDIPHRSMPLNGNWICYCSEQLNDSTPKMDQFNSGCSVADASNVSYENNYESALSYAKSEFRLGNKETAISILKQFAEKWPDNYLIGMTLGEMLWSEGDQKAAVEYLLKAYENKPNDRIVAAKLFNMLIQTEQYDTAKRVLGDNFDSAVV